MKRTLKCRRYGRYVDDFYVVSTNREWLRSLIPLVRRFLGAYLKPHRRYVSGATLRRMMRKLPSLALETNAERLRSRCASFRGVLSHYRTGWLSVEPTFSVLVPAHRSSKGRKKQGTYPARTPNCRCGKTN